MYQLLIRLMLFTALLQFGINVKEALRCNSRECSNRIERASQEVLKIDWKPISIFPEESRRFR